MVLPFRIKTGKLQAFLLYEQQNRYVGNVSCSFGAKNIFLTHTQTLIIMEKLGEVESFDNLVVLSVSENGLIWQTQHLEVKN